MLNSRQERARHTILTFIQTHTHKHAHTHTHTHTHSSITNPETNKAILTHTEWMKWEELCM